MVDVLADTEVVHTLEAKPITTGFLAAERDVKVQLPTMNRRGLR
jgi:hypothetical protein